MCSYIDSIRYAVRLRRLGFTVWTEYGRFRLVYKGRMVGALRFYPDGKPDVTLINDEKIAQWLLVAA